MTGLPILVAVALFFLIAGSLIYLVLLYNELVRLRTDIDRAWSNIDVLLKQRHDEIPNLVEVCKGYMKYEAATLQMVAEARSAYLRAGTVGEKAQADGLATGALKTLFAVAENYPDLKANNNFLKLQARISELEERIADRREFFNDDVATYNARLKQIPEVFVAQLINLQPREFFRVSEDERREIQLKLEQAQEQGRAQSG
jgi:LemA protein